jgi:hypothetical protein
MSTGFTLNFNIWPCRRKVARDTAQTVATACERRTHPSSVRPRIVRGRRAFVTQVAGQRLARCAHGQRTDKILNQPCIDGLVMVHLPLATTIGTVTRMMERNIEEGRLLDLTQFVELTRTWKV